MVRHSHLSWWGCYLAGQLHHLWPDAKLAHPSSAVSDHASNHATSGWWTWQKEMLLWLTSSPDWCLICHYYNAATGQQKYDPYYEVLTYRKLIGASRSPEPSCSLGSRDPRNLELFQQQRSALLSFGKYALLSIEGYVCFYVVVKESLQDWFCLENSGNLFSDTHFFGVNRCS